jgi:hypothetical protein
MSSELLSKIDWYYNSNLNHPLGYGTRVWEWFVDYHRQSDDFSGLIISQVTITFSGRARTRKEARLAVKRAKAKILKLIKQA